MLAAARLWQQAMSQDEDRDLGEIASGEIAPLSKDEIDDSCERINRGGGGA